MPVPGVILGEQSRAGMLRGFREMARLLAITLGPIGGNIANAREPRGEPELLTDAATVARRIIQLPDRAEDAGAMMMRHLAWRVREEVGDGSATTAVLALAIVTEVERIVASGANPMILRRGIEKATNAALAALDEMSQPLEGEERIAAVATAATGNREIGKVLGEMYDVLGPNANIIIEPYIATYHDRAYHEGARFRGGYTSPYFITDQTRRVAILDDACIVAADMNFESVESVQRVLEYALRAGAKGVLFICRSMSERAIGVLTANNERGSIRSCATTLKPVGDLRRGTLENIGILTGGQALSDRTGHSPEAIQPTDLGRANRVIVTREHFTIIGGQGDREVVRERLQKLRRRLRETTDREERETLRELVTHFSAGVGALRIGALTEQDRKALSEVAEQAMKAVQAGMEGGVVPGGGAAYLDAAPAIDDLGLEGEERMGALALQRALEEPMRRIAANANVHPPLVIADARRQGPGHGYDVRAGRVVNMMEAGVVDPTMVAKRALELASSGAIMLLTTEALVLRRKPKETFEP